MDGMQTWMISAHVKKSTGSLAGEMWQSVKWILKYYWMEELSQE